MRTFFLKPGDPGNLHHHPGLGHRGNGNHEGGIRAKGRQFIWIFPGERIGEPVGNMRHSLDFGLCRFFELIFSA